MQKNKPSPSTSHEDVALPLETQFMKLFFTDEVEGKAHIPRKMVVQPPRMPYFMALSQGRPWILPGAPLLLKVCPRRVLEWLTDVLGEKCWVVPSQSC